MVSIKAALHWAAMYWEDTYKQGVVVRLLLEKGANIEARDNTGRTALHWAAERGREEVVQLLLDKGADIEAEDNARRTPWHWADQNGHEVVVQRLEMAFRNMIVTASVLTPD